MGEPVAANSLCVGLMSAGQHGKAIEIFEQQLAPCEELGNRSGVAETPLSLGQCLLRQGQNDGGLCLGEALSCNVSRRSAVAASASRAPSGRS